MSPRVWAGRKPSDTPSPLQHQQPPKAARTSPSREQPRPPPGFVLAHHALPPACVRLQGRNSYASLRTQHSQPSPRGHSLGLPWPPAALRPPPASPGLPRAARSQRNRAMLSYSAPHSPAPPACARTQSMPGIQGPEGSCTCLVPPHPWYPARHTVADRYTCPPGSHSLEVSPEPQGEEAAGTEGVPASGERSRGGVSQAQTWATGYCFSSSRRWWGLRANERRGATEAPAAWAQPGSPAAAQGSMQRVLASSVSHLLSPNRRAPCDGSRLLDRAEWWRSGLMLKAAAPPGPGPSLVGGPL